MLVIPVQRTRRDGRGRSLVLLMILERDNVERLSAADPFDLQLADWGAHVPLDRTLAELDIVIAYEADLAPLVEFQRRQDLDGLIRYLERGRRILPGDCLPPKPL